MEAKRLIEAALFISPRPLMINELGKISGVHSLGHVKEILEELQREYSGRGMEIVSTPNGWEMQVPTSLLPRVSHLTPHSDLSGGQKRTLALVAYKEPVKQSDIIKIQGNKAYSYIKDLVKRGLIKSEKKGHTKILSLTPEFERYFGESRESVKERLRSAAESGRELAPSLNRPETEEPEPKASQNESLGKPPEESREKVREKKETGKPEKKPALSASHSHAFEELD